MHVARLVTEEAFYRDLYQEVFGSEVYKYIYDLKLDPVSHKPVVLGSIYTGIMEELFMMRISIKSPDYVPEVMNP